MRCQSGEHVPAGTRSGRERVYAGGRAGERREGVQDDVQAWSGGRGGPTDAPDPEPVALGAGFEAGDERDDVLVCWVPIIARWGCPWC
jgi:hypothetical protein